MDGRQTLLLVEDEFLLARHEAALLEGEGYTVVLASSGEAAIEEVASNEAIDLILMDIDLGKGMDGTQAARIILQERELPLLFLSSHTEKELVEKTESITNYGYVTKDAGITVLGASIKMAFKLFSMKKALGSAIADDLATKQRFENKISQGEERFRTAFKGAPIGMSLTEFDGRMSTVNQAFCDMLGYSMEEINSSTFMDLTHPDDVAMSLENVRRLRESDIDRVRFQKRYLHRDGHVVWAELSMAKMRNNRGEAQNLISHIVDLTDRIELEHRLRAILENSSDAIGVHVGGIWVTCNPAARRMFGVSSDEELLGKPITEVIEPGERQRIVEYVKSRNSGSQGSTGYVTRGLRRDGSVFDMEVDLSSYLLEGKRHVLVILRDISERQEASRVLRESEEKFRLLFENMGEGFALQEIITDASGKSVDFRFLEANPAYEVHTGQKVKDILGKTALEVMPNADRAQIERYGNVARSGEPMSYEYHSKTYNRFLSVRAFRPQPGRFATVFEDVTERRRTEEELRKTTDELRATFATITAGLSMVKHRTIVMANPSQDAIFGYAQGETIGRSISEFFPDRESFELFWNEAAPRLATGNTHISERLMRRKNGELFWCSVTGSLVSTDAQDEGSIWMSRDISDRKRLEAELQVTFKENQGLLHELQHRVKNSFSMISSMIGLAATEGLSCEALSILHELDGRVRSIAELYSLLYASASFAEVRLDEYITRVASSMTGLTSRVTLVTHLDSISMPAGAAAPIGLIATELITNAQKYAFPDGRAGKIRVSLRRDGEEIVLEVEDDGVGLPPGFEVSKNSGMGMKLVAGLAAQVGGEFALSNSTVGAKACVRWKSAG